MTLLERLECKFIPEPNSGCFLWTASVDTHGYGHLHLAGKTQRAHRLMYELMRGPIPFGMVIDHKCRVRSCVNPDHMRIMTMAENTMIGEGCCAKNARKTHCIHGHLYTEENTVWQKSGRACRICVRKIIRVASQKYRDRKRLGAAFIIAAFALAGCTPLTPQSRGQAIYDSFRPMIDHTVPQ